jgi:hypothetical protein
MLSLKDKIKLVDELLSEDAEATIGSFMKEVNQIEKEIDLIKHTNDKKYGTHNLHFSDAAFTAKSNNRCKQGARKES